MRVTSSRFIGRGTELTELEMALAEARDGRPALAFIAGESGVGKSRLLTEFVERAAGKAQALGGDCLELGDDELPYAPLVAALRPMVRSGDPVIDSLPPPVRAELARLAPELGEPAPPENGDRESGRGESQRRLFEALLTLLAGLGEEAPVVFWLEDAHWADRSTRSFLTFLASSLRDERVLAVVTYRSDELHRRHPMRPLLAELERAPRARRIELPRLDRDEVAVQLEDIFGEAPAPEVVERLYSRSEGNPLFTEELVAAGPDGRGALPPTLRDALLVRLERLPAEGQQALNSLAVASRADHALLGEVSGLESRALDAALREAVAAHLVLRDDEDRYAFRHALLREVVYDDLLPGERSELHLALARALERRCADGKEEAWLATQVAHHYRRAGDQPAALRASVRAADAAEHVGAHGAAAAVLDHALELWERVDNAEEFAGTDHAGLRLRAAEAHYLDGSDHRALQLAEHAAEGMDEATEPARRAIALGERAAIEWSLAMSERSRATLREALEMVPPEAKRERAWLLSIRVKFLLLQGRFQDVVETADDALAAAEAAGMEDVRSPILNRLGHALFALGDEAAGEGALRDAIKIARRSGDNDDLATAFVNWADCLHWAGRSREGAELAAAGLREITPGDRSERWLALTRAEILFALGRWDEAERLIPAPRLASSGATWVNASLRRAELALGRGDADAARPLVEETQEALASSLEPQVIASAGVLRAELERRAGDLTRARAAVDESLDRVQYCSDDAVRIAQLSMAGAWIEADAAERARDLGDTAAEREALARAELMHARVEAAAEAARGRPVEAAYLLCANTELARARGAAGAAEAAAAEAEAWDALERPYPAAIARWREAEAHVAAGDRRAATPVAAAALATARRLGSLWLTEEVSGLAARARLRLDEATVPEDGAGPAAEEEEAPFGLTPRELQVLALVASGATNREIGEQLFMAEKTASVHVSRILRKLEVRSRTEAAAVAHRHGLADASGVEASR
jgi:DNA-binding CsgD family transcriptional regulator/tetratricopeptide (TPR) repeat protein